MKTASVYKSTEGERAVMALYDRMLARWPVPREELYVATELGRTFVVASGEAEAPPLVLLHGASSNALAWMGDVAALSRTFRAYAVDVPGEPGRSAPARPPSAGPAYAVWLGEVLDALGVRAASLAGISQGAWTALKFATCAPERVTGLALLAPGGVAPVRASFLVRALALSLLGRRGAEAINRITFGDTPIHPDAVAFMDVIMTHFVPRIGAPYIFTDEELARLAMPVLLVAGARDALYPSERTAARLARLLPDLKVVLLPEAGHVLHGLGEEVAAFLGDGKAA